jgi:hypothetical protein
MPDWRFRKQETNKDEASMKLTGLLLLALTASCAASITGDDASGTDLNGAQDTLKVNGPLRLALRDFSTPGGILWALPSVTPQAGAIVVENTRYGSLCRNAVTGRADIQARTVALHVTFSERTTICTGEIRALRYTATIATAPGTYDVAVIHEENNRVDTLARRSVVVP